MKKILALLLAVVMVMSMAACSKSGTEGGGTTAAAGSTEPKEIKLTVWAPQEDQVDENSWLQTQLKKFEAAHPEYKITWELGVCSEADASTKVTTDVSAAADVFMYANDQLGTLIEAEALAKLGGSYLEQVKTDNSQTFVDTVTYTDGGVYGFPYTANTWFMYYNTDIYTEEDVKSLETMVEKGTVAFPITNSWYVWSFYSAAGGTLFGPNGVDAAAGIKLGDKATDVTKYLVNLCANSNFINDADSVGLDGLKDGSVAAIFSGTWDSAKVLDALTEKDEDGNVVRTHMGAAQLPTVTINGETLQLNAFAGSKAIGVNKQSKNMVAAMQLAAFLSTEDAQLAHYEMRGVIPAAAKLASNEKVAADAVASAQANTMNNTACVQPTISDMSRFWTPAANMGTAIYNGEVTEAVAAEQTELFEEALNNTGL